MKLSSVGISKFSDYSLADLEGGRAGSAPPPLGDGLTYIIRRHCGVGLPICRSVILKEGLCHCTPDKWQRYGIISISSNLQRRRKANQHQTFSSDLVISSFAWFLPRDALFCIARYWDRLVSVCLSVHNVGGLWSQGWKSWKLIARTISPTPSLFGPQTPSIYSWGNMEKFWGD